MACYSCRSCWSTQDKRISHGIWVVWFTQGFLILFFILGAAFTQMLRTFMLDPKNVDAYWKDDGKLISPIKVEGGKVTFTSMQLIWFNIAYVFIGFAALTLLVLVISIVRYRKQKDYFGQIGKRWFWYGGLAAVYFLFSMVFLILGIAQKETQVLNRNFWPGSGGGKFQAPQIFVVIMILLMIVAAWHLSWSFIWVVVVNHKGEVAYYGDESVGAAEREGGPEKFEGSVSVAPIPQQQQQFYQPPPPPTTYYQPTTATVYPSPFANMSLPVPVSN